MTFRAYPSWAFRPSPAWAHPFGAFFRTPPELFLSARWGTREDIAPYVDPVFQNNVILTKTESLTMNSRPKDPKVPFGSVTT